MAGNKNGAKLTLLQHIAKMSTAANHLLFIITPLTGVTY